MGRSSTPCGDAPLTVTGVVVYRRLFKRILFYDLWLDPSVEWRKHEHHCLELIARLDEYGSMERVMDVRHSVSLGDRVQAIGRFDEAGSLLTTGVSVLEVWKDTHPKQTYEPPTEVSVPHRYKVQSEKKKSTTEALPTSAGETAKPCSGSEALPSQTSTQQQQQQQQEQHVDISDPTVNICRFFLNSGRCAKGEFCPNVHVQTGAMHQVRTSWIKRRKENGKKEASAFGFHVLGPLGGGSDKNVSADSSSGLDQDQQMQLHQGGAAAKGLRAIVLAAWIVETFGKDFLNSGSGVVDVAGGQGALTYELQAVHGVRCTLVEPRPFKLNRFQVKQMKKRADEAAAARAGDMAQHQVEPGSLDTALVEEEFQLLLFGNDSGYDEVEQGEQPENSAANGGSKGASSRVSRPEDAFSQVMDHFEPKLWEEGGPHFELLRSCSMVVGLHPDQATEPILKFALEFKKSFVIAPCCVFPRLFPHRRIKPGTESTLRQPASGQQGIVPSTSSTGSTDNHSFLDGEGLAFDAGGRPVSTYPDLIEYLLQQGGESSKEITLPFEGANRLVYRIMSA